jgi:hypothetical protein
MDYTAGVRGATPNVTPVLVTKASSKIPDYRRTFRTPATA